MTIYRPKSANRLKVSKRDSCEIARNCYAERYYYNNKSDLSVLERLSYLPPATPVKGVDRCRIIPARRLFDWMEQSGLQEAWGSEEGKRGYLEALDFETFQKLLETVNAILRQRLPNVAENIEGYNDKRPVYINIEGGFNLTPTAEDKRTLLGILLGRLQEMSRNNQGLEEIATLLGVGLNAIHLFADGNGRLSRWGYYSLSDRYQENKSQPGWDLVRHSGLASVNLNPESFCSRLVDPLILKGMFPDYHEGMSMRLESPRGFDRQQMEDTVAEVLRANSMDIFFLSHLSTVNNPTTFFTLCLFARQTDQIQVSVQGGEICIDFSPHLFYTLTRGILNRLKRLDEQFRCMRIMVEAVSKLPE
ncbi:Fic family protein [Patescibacteria group bacterium]|nr:Fic family protein [Patescibacteria group bacterium]